MMQTRARTSRRSKVTVRWLPVELILEIFGAVQKLIGRDDFKLRPHTSMLFDQEYNDNLVKYALTCKEWTAVAQSELFKKLILKDRTQTRRVLELVRGSAMFRGYAMDSATLRLGFTGCSYESDGLSGDLDKIALYCPNIVEISCHGVDVSLEYFRNMKKLDKVNVVLGSVLRPSTSGARIQPSTSSITQLSLYDVRISTAFDPSSLPLLRSLHLSAQVCQPIRLLLPQLASLQVAGARSLADLGILVQQSTCITSLSILQGHIVGLDEAIKTVVQERVVDFRLLASAFDDSGDSTLASMIDGSKAMKKVILDGILLGREGKTGLKFLETFKVMKAACKKKKIEFWKDNFEVGNGKVVLEK